MAVSTNNSMLNMQFHGKLRERVIKSHLKYVNMLENNGNSEDFEKIIKHFIETGKSKMYCFSVLTTIVRFLKQINPLYDWPIPKNKVFSTYKKYLKLLQNYGTEMYDNEGNKISWDDWRTLKNIDFINMGVQKNISIDKATEILKKCQNTLDNFWSSVDNNNNNSDTLSYTVDVEVARIILYLSKCGFRINELLNLTYQNVKELLKTNETTIIGKNGLPNTLLIGDFIKLDIERFLKLPQFNELLQKHNRLFVYNYQNLRRANTRLFRSLFKVYRPKGCLFHIWRTYFASLSHQKNPLLTQQTLRHSHAKTTMSYVRNQMLNDKSQAKKMIKNN
ncbi:MAG: integrase [Cotesia congregata filamentous virus 2]